MPGQRRAAAEDEVDAPAQARLDLGEDQLVEERRRLRAALRGCSACAPQDLPRRSAHVSMCLDLGEDQLVKERRRLRAAHPSCSACAPQKPT